MRIWSIGFFLLFFVLLISGCSNSIKEEKKDAIEKVEQVFNDKKEDAKEESKDLSFYLPFKMSIEKESSNNVIIEKGGNDYILFYNQNEKPDSDVVYKMSEPEKDVVVNQIFKKKDRFGYLIISKVNKDNYEVSVGVGGIKMTTESKTKNISNNAEEMMKIVRSVKYKK